MWEYDFLPDLEGKINSFNVVVMEITNFNSWVLKLAFIPTSFSFIMNKLD